MNFTALTAYLDAMPARGVPGCDLEIRVRHETVYRHFSGESHPGTPVNGTETYWLYSASKVFTMTACMQLVERGLMKLTDPVSKYLPAYAHLTVDDGGALRPPRTELTVERLMAMQSGLDYDVNAPALQECLRRENGRATTVQIAEALARKPLNFDPGTRFCYSLSHDVAAAVAEVASGVPFGDLVRSNVIEPLGMKTMTFYPGEEHFARMAARYHWDAQERPVAEDNVSMPYRLSERHESGGAGLVGDVDSYILLCDALANDGVGANGARILSAESIDCMRANRASGRALEDFQIGLNRPGYGYALGVRTLIDRAPSRSSLGEFGWDGAAGAWTLSDPEKRVAAFYAQHVLGCGRAYSEFHPAIRDLIYEGLEA